MALDSHIFDDFDEAKAFAMEVSIEQGLTTKLEKSTNGRWQVILHKKSVPDNPNIILSDSSSPQSQKKDKAPREKLLPVYWSERAFRKTWGHEYINVGSFPVSLENGSGLLDETVRKAISQTLFLFNLKERADHTRPENKVIASILTKIIQRGYCPLPTLYFEKSLIDKYDLNSSVENLEEYGVETGVRWKDSKISKEMLLARFCERENFEMAKEERSTVFDSDIEETFFFQWLGVHFPQAMPWVHLQAPLETLAESYGLNTAPFGARRVDFLLSHPLSKPLVIELDGNEHESAKAVDRQRDETLKNVGITVIRIQNEEIAIGEGNNLRKLHDFLSTVFNKSKTPELTKETDYVSDCAYGSKLQMALVKAIDKMWLSKEETWRFKINGLDKSFSLAVYDWIIIAHSLEQIFGLEVIPKEIIADFDDGTVRLFYLEGKWQIEPTERTKDPLETEGSLHISIERNLSPFHKISEYPTGINPDIIIRPTYLPVNLATGKPYLQGRVYAEEQNLDRVAPALKTLLQQIFRKLEFREGQPEAIFNALKGIDTIVLLPTGAGKSIVYQLSGLIMPGMTFVIDPIIALIDDQVEGLARYGIDRALGISSTMGTAEERKEFLWLVEKGEYHFVLMSPERLQSPQFREVLRAVTESSIINLATIDEAHCVSEWGHEFRTSYLNLGRNLRTFCADRSDLPPPILALTGTASRAVLRDVLADLKIDTSRSESLIRPKTFNREELKFDVRKVRPGEQLARYKGILNALPEVFNMAPSEFFSSNGEKTCSGIIFNAFINKPNKSLGDLRKTAKTICRTDVAIYSGGTPKGFDERTWPKEKALQAKMFKENKAPILVSTKAFGMGIDKPNVRYTIHNGMPGSLEAFYQEAGRAGRDRKDAYCYVLYTENDERVARELVDSTVTLQEISRRHKAIGSRDSDDTCDALFFHLNSFSGVEKEHVQIKRVITEVTDFTRTRTIDIPFVSRGTDDNKADKEKGLFRLLQCGGLSDYEVDFGAKKFILHIKSFEKEHCIDTILDYVGRSQPGRVETIKRELEDSEGQDAQTVLSDYCKVMLDFSYDVIERSRRRAIQEAMETARRARTDDEFRSRILDYLQEGVGHEALEQLIDEEHVDFKEWLKLLGNIHNPIEASELRGIVIRSLESYPSQPGLLVLRATTEAMCSDMDDAFCYESLINAFGPGAYQYNLKEEVEIGLSALLSVAENKAQKLLPNYAYALINLHSEGFVKDELFSKIKTKLLTGKKRQKTQQVFLPGLMREILEPLDQLNLAINEIFESGPDATRRSGVERF